MRVVPLRVVFVVIVCSGEIDIEIDGERYVERREREKFYISEMFKKNESFFTESIVLTELSGPADLIFNVYFESKSSLISSVNDSWEKFTSVLKTAYICGTVYFMYFIRKFTCARLVVVFEGRIGHAWITIVARHLIDWWQLLKNAIGRYVSRKSKGEEKA